MEESYKAVRQCNTDMNNRIMALSRHGELVSVLITGFDFPIKCHIFAASYRGFGDFNSVLWRVIPDSRNQIRKIQLANGRGYNSHNNYYYFFPTWMIKGICEETP